MLLTLISRALEIIVCAEGVGIGLGSREVHKEVTAASVVHRGVPNILVGVDAPAMLVHGPDGLHSLSPAETEGTPHVLLELEDRANS